MDAMGFQDRTVKAMEAIRFNGRKHAPEFSHEALLDAIAILSEALEDAVGDGRDTCFDVRDRFDRFVAKLNRQQA
jgi:hypothetical protein